MNSNSKLVVYNTLTRKKEQFEPLNAPFVGMYVCGPTVYGDAHLGHARSALTFDTIYRFLKFLGYKVRYVRNITDVGHLEHARHEGRDFFDDATLCFGEIDGIYEIGFGNLLNRAVFLRLFVFYLAFKPLVHHNNVFLEI